MSCLRKRTIAIYIRMSMQKWTRVGRDVLRGDRMFERKMIYLDDAVEALKNAILSWSDMPEWRDAKIMNALTEVPSVQLEHDRLNPKIDKNFSSCLDCIHSEDSEYICILRKCVHAIYELRECYTDKRKGEYE